MAYNVVVVFLSWQLILPHLTVVQASTHWVVTEDGRIQAQVVRAVERGKKESFPGFHNVWEPAVVPKYFWGRL